MSHVRIILKSSALPDDAQLQGLQGRESISELFDYQLSICCREQPLQMDSLIGQGITLCFERVSEAEGRVTPIRNVHGVVASCEEAFLDNDFFSYRVRLVPTIWFATLVEMIDVQPDKTIPEIVEGKLRTMHLQEDRHFAFRLSDEHPEREFTVQYKESDMAFMSRLTEHWGISYFFVHSEERDCVVFTDSNSGFEIAEATARVPYVRNREGYGVVRLSAETKLVPRTFVQRDYNYRHPAMDLTGMAHGGYGRGGVVEFGGHFKTSEEAERFAVLRCEERQCRRQVFSGDAGTPQFQAGHIVTVTNHPLGDIPLLIVEVEHHLTQPTHASAESASYRCSFKAIMSNVPFRPERRTPKPRVQGMVTGIVESAQGSEYADVDDQGRYRVRFVFDTSGADEAKASRPLRMMQPHSGAGYGMHFPLRGHTEVLITFVDGDPDRPIIAGTVPNPQTASPVNATNKARNIIRTGGGNEINLDDTDGSKRIKFTVPHSNTTFQLGAPNGREDGAMLQTTGAFTRLATAGDTSIGAFKAGIELYTNYHACNDINTEIKPPAKGWFAIGIAFVTFAREATLALIGTIEAGMEFHEKLKLGEAVKQQGQADEGRIDCEKCRKALKEKLDNYPKDANGNVPAQVAELQAKFGNYNKTIDKVDKLYVASLKARRGRDLWFEKTIGEWTDQNRQVTELEQARTEKEHLEAWAKVTSLQTQPLTETDANGNISTFESVATVEAEMAAAVTAAKGSSDPAVVAFATSLVQCDGCCGAGLQKERAQAERALDDYRALRSSHSEHIQNTARAKTVLNIADTSGLLVSVILFIYSKLKKSQAQLGLLARWQTERVLLHGAGRLEFGGGLPKKDRYMLLAPVVPKSPKHTVVSHHTAELGARHDLLLWSENLSLMGVGTSEATGETDSSLGEINLSSGKKTWVSSKKHVCISAGDKLAIHAPKVEIKASDGLGQPRGDLYMIAAKAVKLQSEKDSILFKAIKSDMGVTTTAHSFVRQKLNDNETSFKLERDGGGSVTTEVKDWKMKLRGEVGFTLKNGQQKMLVAKEGAIGLSADDNNFLIVETAGVSVRSEKFTLRTKNGQLKSDGNITVVGKKILLG